MSVSSALSRTAIVGVLVLLLQVAPAGSRIPPTVSTEEWREDLRYFARELPRRHKNAFHSMSREAFERAVAGLDAALPTLRYHEVVVRLAQITGSVGDGHTRVHLPVSFKRYPLGLFWFDRELRVTATSPEYEKAKGARLVKVGTLPIEEVQARVARCFPSAENENAWYVLATSPAYITSAEVLHALGIASDPSKASFTFEDDQGKSFTLEIAAVQAPVVNGMPALRLTSVVKEEPLFRQRMGEPFSFTTLPDSQTVYVAFRSYEGLGKHAKELFRALDAHPPRRLVIDLRQNGGGDFTEGRKHLIEPIKARPELNQKGRLYVAIGRRTFSAALANAVDFRKETHAILVGEPIGERPNSYSENDEMTLPNSRLVVSYSTRYYKFVDEDVPAVMPDQRIDPTWADFRAGRDPVMDWILASP